VFTSLAPLTERIQILRYNLTALGCCIARVKGVSHEALELTSLDFTPLNPALLKAYSPFAIGSCLCLIF
jgi:hypothetical protein